MLNQSYTHIFQCSFKYFNNSLQSQLYTHVLIHPLLPGFVPWIKVKILQCANVQLNLLPCRIEHVYRWTFCRVKTTAWSKRVWNWMVVLRLTLDVSDQILSVESEPRWNWHADWYLSSPIQPNHKKARGEGNDVCLLCWLFMSTTDLPAGVRPYTSLMH